MNHVDNSSRFAITLASIAILGLARMDLGATGAIVFVAVFAIAIFIELLFIRTALLHIYADALSENRLVLFFIKKPFINIVVSVVISFYLAIYLFIHINLNSKIHFIFYFVAGVMLSLLSSTIVKKSRAAVKERASKVVSHVALIFIAVFTTVLADGIYNAFAPIDSRITEAFDVNIPDIVIQDVKHSYSYLQHLLRTIYYLTLNIQSIALIDGTQTWLDVVRFFLALSPTPYIAYALLFLSLSSISRHFSQSEKPE